MAVISHSGLNKFCKLNKEGTCNSRSQWPRCLRHELSSAIMSVYVYSVLCSFVCAESGLATG
jgi:hypothetical protein